MTHIRKVLLFMTAPRNSQRKTKQNVKLIGRK